MKKIINFLKRIGVLRVGGAKGTYKNAKDAPDAVAFDGELYQSKKEIKAEAEK